MVGGLGLIPQTHLKASDQRFMLSDEPMYKAIDHRGTVSHTWTRTCLNQGNEGTCVGHSDQEFLEAAPINQVGRRPIRQPNRLALSIYDEAWRLENNRGPNDPVDRSTGLMIDSSMKVLRSRGYIEAWVNEFDADNVIRFVGGLDAKGKPCGGPAVIGIPWLNSMDHPDAKGIVRVDFSSGRRGYHAVCMLKWDEQTGMAGLPNHWGAAWGLNGWFHIAGEDLVRMFRDHYGHACTAREIRRKAA